MKPTVPEVLSLVKTYVKIPANNVGGNLHIFLDDGNIKDSNIEFCLNCAIKNKDSLGEKIARLLLQMTKTQRKKIYLNCYAE